MTKKAFIIFFLLHFFNQNLVIAQTYEANWQSVDSRPIPSWFEDAKFGIFIHWGVFSVPSYSPTARDSVSVYDRYAEWYWNKLETPGKTQRFFIDHHNRIYGKDFKYPDFANMFKAEMFNPDDWAEKFKASGAKYVVLTSKHHEGFTLWPSQQSWNWNAVEVGPHRDLCGDLTKSVKEKGLHMGFYYSLYEWFNPLYKANFSKYVDEHMMPQMKDLVTRYQPDVFWTDGEWEHNSNEWKSTQFLSWLYNESPVKNTVVVNDRWGKDTRSKHGGFYTTEYDLVGDKNAKDASFDRPWEENRGMAGSFGYNRNENIEDYSTSKELIDILINKVARGGNLLLNIGPTADGRIPEVMQERLLDMGGWLKINGEAIYATRKWENAPTVTTDSKIYFTKKGTDLYIILTKWLDTPIIVNAVNKVSKVTMLGVNANIKYQQKDGRLIITPPVLTPSINPSNYAWVFKLESALTNSK